MIQYKLIKEYPGSTKLKTIEWYDRKECKTGILHTITFSDNWAGIDFYDAHPEFWQKLEELDYEIINYRDYNGNISDYQKSGSAINSVKRLSDGEVFTIGDVVDGFSYNSRAIEGFILYGRKISIKQWEGQSEFDDIKKSKKTPLFTAEQKKEIISIIKEITNK